MDCKEGGVPQHWAFEILTAIALAAGDVFLMLCGRLAEIGERHLRCGREFKCQYEHSP